MSRAAAEPINHLDPVVRSRAIWRTKAHIARVRELLGLFEARLHRRGLEHDQSKFEPDEMEHLIELQAHIDAYGPAKYGTPKYETYTKILGAMTTNHYARNSHHPEHWPNGVAGMDLFDLVEMFVDWKAASERGVDETMQLGLAMEKYHLDPQLRSIFTNTAERLGWQTE